VTTLPDTPIPPDPDPPIEASSGLPTGAIVGITIGVVLVAAIYMTYLYKRGGYTRIF
jgi:hypothetical protein